jgi:hypothetical protein
MMTVYTAVAMISRPIFRNLGMFSLIILSGSCIMIANFNMDDRLFWGSAT